MTTNFIIYPILYQAITAILLMFFWRNPKTQRLLSILSSSFGLVLAVSLFVFIWQNGTTALQAGNWAAPFGITMVADTFSASLVVLTHIVALAASIYSSEKVISSRIKFGYFPIFHLLIMGLTGAFLTGDIFNLYVWFEIIIISSFVLLTLGGRHHQIEGAVKYFTLNMLASIIFLTAIALLYGITGSLNMAELSVIIPQIENKGLVQLIAIIFFTGFGIKAGVFPLYFWLPASYHAPPAAVSAVFGGLLTKVGVYALIRVFTLIFDLDEFNSTLIMVTAALTLLSGGLGALVQKDIIKVFSYLIICHIGFMIAGLSMNSQVALIGAVFYMFHDIIIKSNLFLISGLTSSIMGSSKLEKMGGLLNAYPKISLLIAIPLFALVGIPPLSGFWPKLSLFGASLSSGNYTLLTFMIFASFITLFIIARIWNQVVAKPKPGKFPENGFNTYSFKQKAAFIVPIILLSLVTLYISFGAEHIQILAERISNELLNTEQYYQAVFKTINP